MTNQTARSSKKERYANLIPMEELHSEKTGFFLSQFMISSGVSPLSVMTHCGIAGMFSNTMMFSSS